MSCTAIIKKINTMSQISTQIENNSFLTIFFKKANVTIKYCIFTPYNEDQINSIDSTIAHLKHVIAKIEKNDPIYEEFDDEIFSVISFVPKTVFTLGNLTLAFLTSDQFNGRVEINLLNYNELINDLNNIINKLHELKLIHD